MNRKTFHIHYDAVHPGTAQSAVVFYRSIPSLFAEKDDMRTKREDVCSRKRMYITDTTVAALENVQAFLHAEKQRGQTVFVMQAGEKHKTAENLLHILETALKANLNRSSVFTAIGGGVVCDISAFAASVFKRGAVLELIPTTLLAMVDAAIGGKTGCDFGSYKNMLGTFYPARNIRIASDFVHSLSESEFRSGLAEVVKTALLYDKRVFTLLKEKKDAVCKREKSLLTDIIEACVHAKARIVEKDLNEQNIRMQLNLGHTFAHALESLAGFGTVSHGEAVAWGIGRALEVSLKLGLCTQTYKNEVFALLENYGWCTQTVHPALHKRGKTGKDLVQAMKQDKKNSSASIRLVLLQKPCSAVIKEIKDEDILTVF